MATLGEPEKVTRARVECCLRACLDQWANLPGHKSSDTLEISFVLKNYDRKTHPWIHESLRLKHTPEVKVNVCILGEEQLCKEAKDQGLPFISPRGLRSIMKKKRLIGKIAYKYDVFLASPEIVQRIPQSLDAAFSRAGKRPFLVMPGESLLEKISETKVVVRFRSKKFPYLSFPIGNMDMELQMLSDNLEVAIDHVLSLLPLQWDNVMSIHIAPKNGTWMPVYC